MATGIYGTTRPADVSIDDIDVITTIHPTEKQ